MHEIIYAGKELELFQHATVWKNYYGKFLKPYLKGRVLEVGAGAGGTTGHLCDGSQTKWVCIEPDPELYGILCKKIDEGKLPSCCSAIKGTTDVLQPSDKFDAIIYVDVIEHIENDRQELDKAEKFLDPYGYLVVLAPAHQFLFSPFDKAIGHYRRYNKKLIKSVAPPQLKILSIKYLDSAGLLASVVNKFVLKQRYPSLKQINLWDKLMVRFSRVTDLISGYRIGKTLVAIWKKN